MDKLQLEDMKLPVLEHWRLLEAIENKDISTIKNIVATHKNTIEVNIVSDFRRVYSYLYKNNVIKRNSRIINGSYVKHKWVVNITWLTKLIIDDYISELR